MDKTNHTQLELFSQSGEAAATRRPGRNSAVFGFMRAYEKTVLIAIGVIITGIISFSIGVERGKKIAGLQNNARLDVALDSRKEAPAEKPGFTPAPAIDISRGAFTGAAEPAGIAQPIILAKNKPAKAQDIAQGPQQNKYTIQLASYRAKMEAEKEARRLKKSGHTALILNKKDYVILCVGKFSKKDTARPLLSQLTKKYPGCYIRKL